MSVLDKVLRLLTGTSDNQNSKSKEEEIQRLKKRRQELEERMRRELSYLSYDNTNIRREE